MRFITYLYIKILHKDEEPNSQLGICFNKSANLRHGHNYKYGNYTFREPNVYLKPWPFLAIFFAIQVIEEVMHKTHVLDVRDSSPYACKSK